MGRVASGFSMSLDGFIAGPGDDVRQVFSWYFSGDTEFRFPGVGDRWAMKVSKASAQVLQEAMDAAGALVTGRRQFDNTNGWDGCHPANVPVFVVSHRPAPAEWLKAHPNAPFTFVPEGVEAAIARAQKVARDKTVIVDGARSSTRLSGPGWWTRSPSTWCPCCSVRACGTSTRLGPRRSGWSTFARSKVPA